MLHIEIYATNQLNNSQTDPIIGISVLFYCELTVVFILNWFVELHPMIIFNKI